jgi:Zn-dependent peptidase ImmA (M78 family)/transcriptional regulator with XRE-family HTH domain
MKTVSLVELGERLRNARKAAGISQEEASAKTGIPQPSISTIESGKRSVDSLELFKFAELYKRPIEYFLSPNFREDADSFSSLLATPQILDSDRAVLDDFRVFCNDYADLELLVLGRVNHVRVFEDVAVPKTKHEAIEQGTQYAARLREIFGLGIEPMYDVRLFLDTIGIKVIKRKLNTQSVTGIYVYSSEYGHCVLVNRSGNRQVDRFSLAHTFCHALVDWQAMHAERNFIICNNWGKDDLTEHRASMFALSFLMPTETVEKVWLQMRTQPRPSVFDTIAIARYFGVDYESALYRFVQLGLVSEEERETLRNQLARSGSDIDGLLGYTASEVRTSGEELYPDRYIKLGLEALRLGRISVARLAKYLSINIYDINQLIEKMGLQAGQITHD